MGFRIKSLVSKVVDKARDIVEPVVEDLTKKTLEPAGDTFEAATESSNPDVIGGQSIPGSRVPLSTRTLEKSANLDDLAFDRFPPGGEPAVYGDGDFSFVTRPGGDNWQSVYGDGDFSVVTQPGGNDWQSIYGDGDFSSPPPGAGDWKPIYGTYPGRPGGTRPIYGDGDLTPIPPGDRPWPGPIYGDGDLSPIYYPPGYEPNPGVPGFEPFPPPTSTPPTSPPPPPTNPPPVEPEPAEYAPTAYDRAHGVITKGYDHLVAAADAYDEDVPSGDAHGALTGGGFAEGLEENGEALLHSGWELVKDHLDGPGRAIEDAAGWVWDNLGKPAVGWTEDKVFRPAAALLEEFVGEPVNHELAKGYAAARGIPEDEALAEIEGAEEAIGGFVKGFAEEGIDIAESLADMALEPGQTVENFAKLGYMLATKPHETIDAITTQISDKYGDWRTNPETAGRVVAEIASLFVGPEGLAAAEGADAARGASAAVEFSKSVATSLETREAALEEALADAEDVLETLEEGTPEYERAAADVETKRIDLLEEQGNQLETYDQTMDLMTATKQHLEETIEDPDRKLTPAEKAALEASKDEVEAGIENLTNLRKESLEDTGELMREYASFNHDLSHEQRLELGRLAAHQGVKITPYQDVEGGKINFAVEGADTKGDEVAAQVRNIVGHDKAGTFTFDDTSALDGAEVVHPTHGGGSYALRGGGRPKRSIARPDYSDESRGVPADIDDEQPVASSPAKKPKGQAPGEFLDNRIAALGSGTQDGVNVVQLAGEDLDAAYATAVQTGLDEGKVVLRLPPGEDGAASALEVEIPGADLTNDPTLREHFENMIEDWNSNVQDGGNAKKLSEVLGELSTTKAVLAEHPDAQMVFGYAKGGKTGIDQLWKVDGADGTPTYIFAEAKGGGSGLGTDIAGIDQMSDTWITDRLVERATGDTQSAMEARQVLEDLGIKYQGRGVFKKDADGRWVTGGKGEGHFVLSDRGTDANVQAMIVREQFDQAGQDFASTELSEARPLQPASTVAKGLHIPDKRLGSMQDMLYDVSDDYKALVDQALEDAPNNQLDVEITSDPVDGVSFDPATGKIKVSEQYLKKTDSHPTVAGELSRAMYYAANRQRFADALATATDAEDYARKIMDIKRDAILATEQVQADGDTAKLFTYPGPFGSSRTAFNPIPSQPTPTDFYMVNQGDLQYYAAQYDTVKNGGTLVL